MSRAAFVADRFMRFLGLPGKAFVPMLVGFGCSVPALMGTRVMENKRERFLTLFLVPFMSCGARLPVYALFGAAFFGKSAGTMVFAIYVTGIVIALIYGLLLRHTLFKGKESTFIMELPPYHMPKPQNLLRHAWLRLKEFIFRAGKIVVIMVTILGFMGSVGTDGSIGNENSEKSILSAVGTAITPVFEPFGIAEDNWPASVALFTGLFAKEAIVGTLNSLYAIEGAEPTATTAAAIDSTEAAEFHLGAIVKSALYSIPQNLKGIFAVAVNPRGGSISEEMSIAEDASTATALSAMRARFSLGKFQVLAYLLFILLYVPCIAAMSTAFRELGKFYGTLMMTFQTAIGWSLATLFFQITCGKNALWIAVSIALLAGTIMALTFIGKSQKNRSQFR